MTAEINRTSVVEMLRQGIVNIKFTKKNGDVRNMKCTLVSAFIPEEKRARGVLGPVDESVVRVYDVDSDGWRSFTLANVLMIESL